MRLRYAVEAMIDERLADLIEKAEITTVQIRSPLTCEAEDEYVLPAMEEIWLEEHRLIQVRPWGYNDAIDRGTRHQLTMRLSI